MNITVWMKRAAVWVFGLTALILALNNSPAGSVAPALAYEPTTIDECLVYGHLDDDDDDDDWRGCFEDVYGSDPENALSTPEHILFDALFEVDSCSDAVDNDLDGSADDGDPGCAMPHECVGPLRSALVRSGLLFSVRHPETGETLYFGHFNKQFNPGDYRGTAGWNEFVVRLLGGYLGRTGCALHISPDIFGCIDFDSEDPCPPGDTDDDGFEDFEEVRLGSDPNDAGSTPEYALLDEQTGSQTCGDGVDNDLDGRKDKGDSGCTLTCKDFGTKERCLDEDGDGWLKYVELWHGSDPDDPASYPGSGGGIGDCIDFDGVGCGHP